MRIAGLVLAAGAGTRLGRPKANVRVDGRRLVDLAVECLRDGGADPVVVVAGAADVGHVDGVVAVNDRWAEGLGSSLRSGLAALSALAARTSAIDGVVVLLVDQPRISARAVERILGAGRAGAHAAVATYGGVGQHPVYFHASAWAEVGRAAVGDRGARPYLLAHRDRVVTVACDGLGTPDDVDTPADLARLTPPPPASGSDV